MSNASEITIGMTWTHCCECSMPFALPDYFIARRREDGETFYCPNGHELTYPTRADARNLRRRQDEILKLHEEEQAEARAAEATAKAAPTPAPSDRPLTIDDYQRRDKSGRLRVCPHCGKMYRSNVWFGNHVRDAHGVDLAALACRDAVEREKSGEKSGKGAA